MRGTSRIALTRELAIQLISADEILGVTVVGPYSRHRQPFCQSSEPQEQSVIQGHFNLDWKRGSNGSELLFTSPITGHHFHASPIQQDYLRPAGWCLVTCSKCEAAIGKRCTNEKGEAVAVHAERRALA